MTASIDAIDQVNQVGIELVLIRNGIVLCQFFPGCVVVADGSGKVLQVPALA